MLQVQKGKNDYKRISLGMSASEREWNLNDARFKGKKYQTLNRDLADIEARVTEIIDDMYKEMRKERKSFSYNDFKAKFHETETTTNDKSKTLLGFLIWYMGYLKEKERIGDHAHYQTLRSVFVDFGVSERLELLETLIKIGWKNLNYTLPRGKAKPQVDLLRKDQSATTSPH